MLQIAHRMWQGDERLYEGTRYRMLRPLNSPNALRRPHPPIMIGGGGEQKTLRLVARYGDMCNLFDLPDIGCADNLRHKLDVLRRRCDAVGRDYTQLARTTTTLLDTVDRRSLDHLAELAELGIDHAIVSPRQPWDDAALDAVAGVLTDVEALPTRYAA